MKRILVILLIIVSVVSFAKIAFSANYILSGKLTDSLNSPLQANISASSLITKTNSYGNYLMSIPQGTYNINYSLQNMWISLPSLNLDSNKLNLVNFIYQSNKKVSFNINISQNQTVQVSSSDKPIKVQINGTQLSEVSSLSSLAANTWFYDSVGKRLYVRAKTSTKDCNSQCLAQQKGYTSGICRSGSSGTSSTTALFNGVWCYKKNIDTAMLKDLVSHQIFNVFVAVGYPNWEDDSRLSTINPVTGLPIVPENEVGIMITPQEVANFNQLLASVDPRLRLWAWFGTWSSLGTSDASGHELAKVDLSTSTYRSWIIENIVRVANYGFYGIQDDTEDIYQTSTFAQRMQDQVYFWNEEQVALRAAGKKLATFTYAGPPSLWTYNPPYEFVKQLKVDYIILTADSHQTQEVIDNYGSVEEIWKNEIKNGLSAAQSPALVNVPSAYGSGVKERPLNVLLQSLSEINPTSYPSYAGHTIYIYDFTKAEAITSSEWTAWDNYLSTLPGTTSTTSSCSSGETSIGQDGCSSGQTCCCSGTGGTLPPSELVNSPDQWKFIAGAGGVNTFMPEDIAQHVMGLGANGVYMGIYTDNWGNPQPIQHNGLTQTEHNRRYANEIHRLDGLVYMQNYPWSFSLDTNWDVHKAKETEVIYNSGGMQDTYIEWSERAVAGGYWQDGSYVEGLNPDVIQIMNEVVGDQDDSYASEEFWDKYIAFCNRYMAKISQVKHNAVFTVSSVPFWDLKETAEHASRFIVPSGSKLYFSFHYYYALWNQAPPTWEAGNVAYWNNGNPLTQEQRENAKNTAYNVYLTRSGVESLLGMGKNVIWDEVGTHIDNPNIEAFMQDVKEFSDTYGVGTSWLDNTAHYGEEYNHMPGALWDTGTWNLNKLGQVWSQIVIE